MDPPAHLRLGVAITVGLVDAITRCLLAAPGRTFGVSSWDGSGCLKTALSAARDLGVSDQISASDRSILVVANHNTFLDAPMLAPLVGRASARPFAGGLAPWAADPLAWPFTAAGAFLFGRPGMATIISLVCGLPVQQKWIRYGEPHPKEFFALNQTRNLPDLVRCLAAGRTVLYFPEGRLVQDAVEPRDEQGRWMQPDGRWSEQGGRVATFFSGVGRIVAHSGAVVLPVAHFGLDDILPAGSSLYNLKDSSVNFIGPANVAIHVSKPLDFRPLLRRFETSHPHLTPFGEGGEAMGAADAMCPEKRALYREITEKIRQAVLEAHAVARENAEAASLGGSPEGNVQNTTK